MSLHHPEWQSLGSRKELVQD
uniref:Uncharacterized protein n=1 Tax=Anguilla anguilla TaxID=7936 RepID=A0A0E9U6B3_ANGAN